MQFLWTLVSPLTDKAKINEQNKSIAVGTFYIGTYFEPIWTLLPEDVAVLNPTGCNVGTSHVVCCVKNRNPIVLIFRKIYIDLKYVIKLNPCTRPIFV